MSPVNRRSHRGFGALKGRLRIHSAGAGRIPKQDRMSNLTENRRTFSERSNKVNSFPFQLWVQGAAAFAEKEENDGDVALLSVRAMSVDVGSDGGRSVEKDRR
ncbi:hypothetical protein M0802_013039 [Mischocyttarus mexicanus]|nr:hypothetical protein M0802_013047 [Mischocyttarus mexicanus]KAI4484447.1 hypothetical protein M0802_013039 [Mischocyttarus mexicanus]